MELNAAVMYNLLESDRFDFIFNQGARVVAKKCSTKNLKNRKES